ncbi:MAG: YqgE/AlgH family protein [Pirellulaceae bacterium]
MESIQGRALVASPYLTDSNFLRAVVYILKHDEDGAIGLILNRPMQTTVGALLEQCTENKISNDQPVYCGGPVDGPLMVLQCVRGDGGEVVLVGSEQDQIVEVCSRPNDDPTLQYRVFDGYSGWGDGQLDAELRAGGWLLWDIEPSQIFGDCNDLWKTAVREIGRDILASGIDPERMPVDPAYN